MLFIKKIQFQILRTIYPIIHNYFLNIIIYFILFRKKLLIPR